MGKLVPPVASEAGFATTRTRRLAFFFFVERGIVVFYDIADSIEILAKSVNFLFWGQARARLGSLAWRGPASVGCPTETCRFGAHWRYPIAWANTKIFYRQRRFTFRFGILFSFPLNWPVKRASIGEGERTVLTVTKRYSWEEIYEAAILETDFSRLPERIKAAQTAIDTRMKEMQQDHQGTPAERAAIQSALAGIRILKREAL